MRLVAIRPVLYRSVQYGVGAELPADNEAMVEAWVAFKSASWVGAELPADNEAMVEAELPADNEAMVEAWVAFKSASWVEDEPPRKPPKAVPVSPPEGKSGLSSDGDPSARLGRRSKR